MINVRVRMGEQPAPLVRIGGEILHHVFVNIFLQINSDGTVTANDLVSADAGVRWNVAPGVRDPDVLGDIAHGMVGALDGGIDQALRKFLTRNLGCRLSLSDARSGAHGDHQKESQPRDKASHAAIVKSDN